MATVRKNDIVKIKDSGEVWMIGQVATQNGRTKLTLTNGGMTPRTVNAMDVTVIKRAPIDYSSGSAKILGFLAMLGSILCMIAADIYLNSHSNLSDWVWSLIGGVVLVNSHAVLEVPIKATQSYVVQ